MLFDCYKPTLARKFTAASSHRLTRSSAAVSDVPLTMSAWFLANNVTSDCVLIGIADKDVTNHLHLLQILGSVGGDPVRALSRDSGGFSGGTSGTFVANTWAHAAGVWSSTTSRRAYFNGSPGAADTASRVPANLDATDIGRAGDSTPTEYMEGQIVWPAIWNVALSDAEVALLASGVNPLTVRPESLVAFWDWTGAGIESGLKAAYPLTNSGSVPVNGPAFLKTRIPRPWMLGSGYVAATGNRRRRIICGAATQ